MSGRFEDRGPHILRPVSMTRDFLPQAEGSVLVEMGKRSEGGEEDERGDLETGNQDRKQPATHGASLSSALLPKST